MPIYGLTDRQESFLRLAKIKKGEKDEKTGAPRDLDYFRLVFSYGCEDVERAFKAIYGEKPTRINMRLAFPDLVKVWDAYYVAYETGGLLAKAGSNENGLYWVWYRDHDTKEILVRNGQAIGPRGEEFISKKIDITKPIYSYKNKKGEDTPVFLEPEGRLSIVIPELATIDGKPRVGYFDFCPGSPRDIGTMSGELAAIELWAKQVGKNITGIPMVLTRRKEMITKNIKGVLSQGPSWVVHIEVGGEWGGKALEFMQMKALPDVIDADYEDVSEFVDSDPVLTPPMAFPASVVPLPPQAEPESAPEPRHEPHTSPLLEEKKAESAKLTRPYAPADFKAAFEKLVGVVTDSYAKNNLTLEASDNERKILASIIDTVFGDKGVSRHPFCTWLCGVGSTKDMTPAQVKALFRVMEIRNDSEHPASYNDAPSAVSIQEFKEAYLALINGNR